MLYCSRPADSKRHRIMFSPFTSGRREMDAVEDSGAASCGVCPSGYHRYVAPGSWSTGPDVHLARLPGTSGLEHPGICQVIGVQGSRRGEKADLMLSLISAGNTINDRIEKGGKKSKRFICYKTFVTGRFIPYNFV